MNDGNDKHEGAWWGNLETLKPSQVQSDYSYVDEDDRRKKFIINTIIQNHLCICNRGNKPVSSAANPSLEQRKEYMRPIQEMKSLIFHCK